MSAFVLPVPVLAFLGLSCGPAQSEASSGALAPPGMTYAWRRGAEVPWFGDDVPRFGDTELAPDAIPFGELGRTPRTRLYLTFNGDLARELGAQGARSTREPARVAGRFGGGLSLAGGETTITLESASGAPSEPGSPSTPQWTVECWVWTEELRAGAFLALSGLFVARCDAAGHVVLEARGTEPTGEGRATSVKSSMPLRPREWNHVGLVLDGLDTHSLRVVVNGEARGKRLASLSAPPPQPVLVLGGRSRLAIDRIDELRLQERAANTEEFQDSMRGPRALERLRLTRDGRTEEREVWFQVLRSPRLESPADWTGGELEHVRVDEHGLARAEASWREIEACDPPVARTTHATAFLGAHRILVFGGETRDSHHFPMRSTDDTWIFDTRAESWQRLAPGPAPSGRCHQAAAYSPDHDAVLLGGGFDITSGKPVVFADTWLYHVGAGRWERCREAGEPYGFSDDAVVYHARRKVFVAINGRRVRTFDPATRTWRTLAPASVVDEAGRALEYLPAGSMSAGYDPRDGSVFLFGGSRDALDDQQYVDDTYLYDLDANRLTLLAPRERPSPRVRAAVGWDPRRERFVLFGGVRSHTSERMGDLWSFTPGTRRWVRHEAAGAPSARGGYYGLEYDPELARFFLLCGRHSRERFLAEAWTLSLDAHAPGRARYVFDRAAFPEATAWFAEVEAPGDARVQQRFRASEDASAWGEWSMSLPAGRFLQVELTLSPGSSGEEPRVRKLGFQAPG